MSQKVRNANTHILRRQNHEHAHSSRSVQGSSMGWWMKVQGKFKMQAHISNGVVMDIAAFKVSHSVGIDEDATALPAARARSSSIHRGNGGNVTEGSKCELPPHNTAHTQGTRSNSAWRWSNCLGRFKLQAPTSCKAIMDERAHSKQSVQGGNGGNVTECSKCELPPHKPAHTQGTQLISAGQTHPTGDVVMDIAAFKVSHSVITDKDATLKH